MTAAHAEGTSAVALPDEPAVRVVEPTGREVIAAAQDDAKELAAVIEQAKAFTLIRGKKHVHVDGWTTLAAMKGCMVREVEAKPWKDPASGEPSGWEATVELVRMSDGAVISRASSMAGQPDDMMSERTSWADQPAYAQRSMAITRATGKVCRIAFSWVMVLTGYSPTPREEMRGGAPAPSGDHPRPMSHDRPQPAKDSPEPVSQDTIDKLCHAAKEAGGKTEAHPFRVLDGSLDSLGYEGSPKGTKTWAAMVVHLKKTLSEGAGGRVLQYIEDGTNPEVPF